MVTGFIQVHFSTPLLHLFYPSYSIHQPTMHPPIYPVIYSLTHPFLYPLSIIHLLTYQPIQSSTYLLIHSHNIYLYTYPPICPSTHPSIHSSSIHPSIHLSLDPHNYISIHLSVIYLPRAYPHPPTHLYIYPLVHYSTMHITYPFTHSSIIHPLSSSSSHLHIYHSNTIH